MPNPWWIEEKERFDEHFETALAPFLPSDDQVIERILYPLRAGGKRIRPILLTAFGHLFSQGQGVEHFALALECIHTYSLVHDDLPAMDDDDLRRGRPTAHVEFSEADAILIGDGLLNLAMEVALGAKIDPPERHLKALRTLFLASGYRGMIYGQHLDIHQKKPLDGEALDTINAHKTGALIEAACRVGAILGGASSKEEDLSASYGRTLGRAFQIVDDLLDISGDSAVIGKPVGSDAKNEKSTYPMLLGLERAREEVRRLTDQAISDLKALEKDTKNLEALTLALLSRDA